MSLQRILTNRRVRNGFYVFVIANLLISGSSGFSSTNSAYAQPFFSTPQGESNNNNGGGGGADKITICHATSSKDNPYTRIVISPNASNVHFDDNGTQQAGHEEDLRFDGDVPCPESGPYCGDNIISPGLGETCDDGNSLSGDGCSDECLIEFYCGDGNVNPGEQCDDGNNLSGDSCSAICNLEVCGNTIVDPGEQCDDGNDSEFDQCSTSCELTYCGDTFVQDPNGLAQSESCDAGVLNGTPLYCNAQCSGLTTPVCGNGTLEELGGEQCDDNNNVDGDGCNASCKIEVCGNGIIDSGETCDDSNTADGDGCSATCTTEIPEPFCGDGAINQSSEQCDDGNDLGGDGCNETCQIEACGNNTIDSGEQCDDGNLTSGDGCNAVCHNEICGNDILDQGEQCDDDNTIGGDGCSATCTIEECLNQTLDVGEACEPGITTLDPHQQCTEQCTIENLTYCGDGVAQDPNEEELGGPNNDGYEACDGEEGVGENETCTLQCTIEGQPFCGDGEVNNEGEECDDDNDVDDDSCSNSCQINEGPSGPVCGNDIVESGEECDDGNTASEDGCSSSCTTESLQCTGSKTYTINNDFDHGSLINVNYTPADQLQLSNQVNAFNFIWVAVSSKGTVVKIDTDTGAIVGEYKTSPSSQSNGDPSRTTVDKDGSVWLSNRSNVFNGHGSIIHIGLVENGQCEDRNSNGVIDTSTAQNDIKAWADASGTRNVGTAADECVVHYVELPNSSGTRHVSVDANNDVWVAGLYSRNFDLVKGGKWDVPISGTVTRSEASVGYGGYGGLIDPSGVIWSASRLLRWDTANPLTGANGTNWSGYEHDSYGLCIDSQGNVWNTSLYGNQIRKFAPNGTLLGTFTNHGSYYAQGCAVDQNDNVWVAHSLLGNQNTVGHLLNNGTFIGNVTVGSGPTGVSVDANGKIWSTDYYSGQVSRIDPAAGPIGADLVTPVGAVDFTSVNLGGNPYNYSDMTGSTLSGQAESGTWTVIHDGTVAGFPWNNVSWNADVPSGASLAVTVATSTDGIAFGVPQTITSGQDLSALTERYLKIVVSFERSSGGETPILYDLSPNRDCGGDEPPTPPEPPTTPSGGGGGGGGGGGRISLSIFNETTDGVTIPTALVSWFTNLLATCRVVYGTASQEANASLTNYGYPSSTDTESSTATYHITTLTDLEEGTTYYWRPICSASGQAEKAGAELHFVVAAGTQVQVLGFTTEPDDPKVLGFESLPTTSGDFVRYYVALLALFSVVMTGLSLGYRRTKDESAA